jgi:hypothetical protein
MHKTKFAPNADTILVGGVETVLHSINDATIANNSITSNQCVFELKNDGKDRAVGTILTTQIIQNSK